MRRQREWDLKRKLRELENIVDYHLEGKTATAIGRILNLSKQLVQYYVKKFKDPAFHCGQIGGYKGKSIFKEDEIPFVQAFIIDYFKNNPASRFFPIGI